ncbi:MAG: hypothetical protein OEY59_08200, partial [Deltaproteobacteria bacterium]|nr:hypothetical protein [Deltaproteobacteria bacterium]
MKNYQLFKPISIIAALLFLVSCGDFDNKADGPVMVKVNFQLSLSDKSPQKLKSQGGSILTSVVYAVPDTVFYENETTSVQVFDRALLNTADNTVSLTVPLATPIKLVQENYNQNFSLSEISTLQGTYAAKGISASFSLTSDQAQQNVTLYFGKFSTAAITKEVLPGLECPFGGIAVETGIDENRNGVLDTLEVDNTEYVCNGADGASGYSALVSVTDELAGTNCPSGGKKIEAGLDTNSNAILDTTEITSTSYLCTDGPSVIETIPPTATVLLNNGDTSVVGSYVMMSLSAQDNSALTSVYISESPTVPVSTSAGWYPLMVNVEFNEQVRWTLSPGTGVKTIYVWFKDIFG